MSQQSTRQIAQDALRLAKSLVPPVKYLKVMDMESKSVLTHIAPAVTPHGNAALLGTDETPWPIQAGGTMTGAAFYGTAFVATQYPTQICRPLQAICRHDHFEYSFPSSRAVATTRETDVIEVEKVECKVLVQPDWSSMHAWRRQVDTAQTAYDAADGGGAMTALLPRVSATTDIVQQQLPRMALLIWYELPQAASIHQMQRENDIADSYVGHLPTLTDLFQNLYQYIHERDHLDDQLLDAVPITYPTGLQDRGRPSLHSSEFRHWVFNSRINNPAMETGYRGPFFKVHKIRRIVAEPPLPYNYQALFKTGMKNDQAAPGVTTADTETRQAGTLMDTTYPTGAFHEYGQTAYSAAAVTADGMVSNSRLDYVGSIGPANTDSTWFQGYIRQKDTLKFETDTQWHEFDLDMNGLKVRYDDGGTSDPTAATPVAAHSPFGLCQKDLRLAIISTHDNSFWRMRFDVGVRFRG